LLIRGLIFSKLIVFYTKKGKKNYGSGLKYGSESRDLKMQIRIQVFHNADTLKIRIRNPDSKRIEEEYICTRSGRFPWFGGGLEGLNKFLLVSAVREEGVEIRRRQAEQPPEQSNYFPSARKEFEYIENTKYLNEN